MELQELLARKAALLAEVSRIAENCEGLDNESNVAQAAALNDERSRLTAKKAGLENQLEFVSSNIARLDDKITALTTSGVSKILAAIKNQRWYFFKNRPKIIFDRDTALIWANLHYFAYGKNGNTEEYNAKEIRALLTNVNAAGIDGYRDWRIPTPFELSRIIEDKACPYRAADVWKMMKATFWCVNANGSYRGKLLEPSVLNHNVLDMNRGVYVYGNWNYNVFVLPCSGALVPADYENSISAFNTVYSEAEKLQLALNIFLTNDLEPIFTDEAINEIFRQLYIVKPELQGQLTEVQGRIDELSAVEVISPDLDWRALRLKFDAEADSSPMRYAAEVRALTEFLLARLEVADLAELREELEGFRAEAVALERRAVSAKTLADLVAVRSEPRPPFELVVEALAAKVRAALVRRSESDGERAEG